MSNPYFVPHVKEKKEKSTEVKAKKPDFDWELARTVGADILVAFVLIGGSFTIGYYAGVTDLIMAIAKESAKTAATS